MSVQYNPLDNAGGGETAYRNLRWGVISNAEGFRSGLYYDSKGILTTGFGFNLQSTAIQTQVIKAMGLDTNAGAGTKEGGYVTQIRSLLNANLTGVSGNASSLQAQINAIMGARAGDTEIPGGANKKTTFLFSDKDSARAVFEYVAETQFSDHDPSYEERVNDWLSGIAPSRERAVLFSLAYNGGA